jgi:thiol-disulfide isomerase/thioredoxin
MQARLPAVMPGLVVSACGLLSATALGFAWRARNGRVRAAVSRTAGPRAGDGRVRAAVSRTAGPRAAAFAVAGGPASWLAAEHAESPASGLTADDIGAPLGGRATLVQFSSAFCAPCRATRRILADVASIIDGVSHVEIDAESRLDLVRRLDVRRTPTTLVLGRAGEITHRASGQPRKADVIAALGSVI